MERLVGRQCPITWRRSVRVHKMAGLLSAVVLAIGLSITVLPESAQAAVTPTPGAWYEIYAPLFFNGSYNECVDVPGATTSFSNLQIFHCHGYASNGANQRWVFVYDPNHAAYEIMNVHSGLCMVWGGTGAKVHHNTCDGFEEFEWRFVFDRNDPTRFQLEDALYTDQCLSMENSSGQNQTPLTSGFCNSPDGIYYNKQVWALG
jgi:hypothetical protein